MGHDVHHTVANFALRRKISTSQWIRRPFLTPYFAYASARILPHDFAGVQFSINLLRGQIVWEGLAQYLRTRNILRLLGTQMRKRFYDTAFSHRPQRGSGVQRYHPNV